jgi:hypothetical protein
MAENEQLRLKVDDYQQQMQHLKQGEERAYNEAQEATRSATNYREDLSFLTKEQSRLNNEITYERELKL